MNVSKLCFVAPISTISSSSFVINNNNCKTKFIPQRQQRNNEYMIQKTKRFNYNLIKNTLTEEENNTTISNNNNNNNNNNNEETTIIKPILRLTAAERARTLVHICKSATLCTSSVRHDGIPFGSHVDFIQDEQGRPVFLLAANANHTRNLANDSRCSLFCQPSLQAGQDGCRVTLVGEIEKLNKNLENDLRLQYEEIHQHASEALKYKDIFKFYIMNINDILFVSGYGVLSQWVNNLDFQNATPDNLAFDAPNIVKHLNNEKQNDLKRLCKIFLNNENNNDNEIISCSMTSLDRLGFDLRVKYDDSQTKEFRVGFREQVNNRFDVQSSLVKTFQEAWERENGFDETWEEEDTRPTVLYYSQSPQ